MPANQKQTDPVRWTYPPQRSRRSTSLLDKEVNNARRCNSNGNGNRTLVLPEPEPWPESVDGDDLLDQLCRTFTRYLALPQGADVILALWTVHAHTP